MSSSPLTGQLRRLAQRRPASPRLAADSVPPGQRAGEHRGAAALTPDEPTPVTGHTTAPAEAGAQGTENPLERDWACTLTTLTRVRDGLLSLPGEARPGGQPPPEDSDPAQAAIQASFARVAEAADEAIGYFYARMFTAHPGLRELFPAAMDQQRDRLFRALARLAEGMPPSKLAAYLEQLGRDHRKYGVEPWMYDAVGEALLATIAAYASDLFTDATRDAWTAAYSAASAAMISAAEADAQVSPATWDAKVIRHEDRGNSITVLTVATSQPLPYAAGQHITVQTSRHPRVWRHYSVATAPRDDTLLDLHVRAVPGGWVSTALARHALRGDWLTLGPAMGAMTLDPADDSDLLCIAGGTGLSPVKAIAEQAIRDAARTGPSRRIHFYVGARTQVELYDMRSLWRLTDACPQLQLTPVTSDDLSHEGMQGNVGRVAARYLPHRGCVAYVAGPPEMVEDAIEALAIAGLTADQIRYDDALLTGRRYPDASRWRP